MRAFTFKAVAGDSGLKEGTIYAPSLTVARNSLLDEFDRLLSIEPVRREKPTRTRYVPANFTRQLAVLIRSGVTINKSILLLADQVDNNLDLQVALIDINLKILGGSPLSRALEAHPRFFSPLYIAMCRVGEVRGDLPRILLGLAKHQEMEDAMRRRIVQALTYPAVILCITALLTMFLCNVILPYFVEVFDSMHIDLPLYSQVLILTVRLTNNPLASGTIALVLGCGVYYARLWMDTASGRYFVDDFILRMPLVGGLQRKIIIIRFAKSMSLLIDGGIYTMVALDLCSYVVQNELYARALSRAQKYMIDGKGPLSAFLRLRRDLFPDSFTEFVRAGEESGHLTGLLNRAAELYEVDVEHTTNMIMAALEPILMAITGSIVGFIVLSIFVPLYSQLGRAM